MELRKDHIAVGILAQLFNTGKPMRELYLLKKLGQASFDVMTDDDGTQFHNCIQNLIDSGHIKKWLSSSDTYEITGKGIIAFKKNIRGPFLKIAKDESLLGKITNPRFVRLKNKMSPRNIGSLPTKLSIINTPLLLAFLDAGDAARNP